ncbi:MAG TPA: diadenylate cyclase CdaA [Candidatus Brocadiia bacterium]|nr:diadenylate cyclase CdaA [Candidatus Brocadiia bacterium]
MHLSALFGFDWGRLLRIFSGLQGLKIALIEIGILFVLIYVIFRLMRGTQAVGVLRGIAVLGLGLALLIQYLIIQFQLTTLKWIFGILGPVIIPLVVLFQPEIRRALVKVGENPLLSRLLRHGVSPTQEIVRAATDLGKQRIGALMVLERDIGLAGVVEGGSRLDSAVTADLLKTIFWPGSPLHDGGVVIHEDRILAAGCVFPLTENTSYGSEFGTRHRAGIGITEESDAIAVIVSEETGRISIAHKGNVIRGLQTEEELARVLTELTTVSGLSGRDEAETTA